MEDKVRQGYLLDFYGELLTEHQRKLFRAYAFDDLSQSEIAEEEGISRQGVFDLLRRCMNALEGYESKLHLLEKFLRVREKVGEIHVLTEGEPEDIKQTLFKIRELSSQILEEL